MGKLIDADKLLADLKDKKKSLRESLNFAKREGETKWADELREQMQILTLIIDGVEHGGYDPDPISLPTIKPGEEAIHKDIGNVKILWLGVNMATVSKDGLYYDVYLKDLEVIESD